MKTIQQIIRIRFVLYALLLCSLSSCTGDFEEINRDPIRPSNTNQGSMLGQVEYRLVNSTIGTSKQFTHELMQVTAPRESASGDVHRYEILPKTGTGIWENIYNRLIDLSDIEDISKEAQPNYQAIAITLRMWAFSILTDAFGPVPFSEAGRAREEILTPKFDQQKDIYVEMLAQLAQANSLVDTKTGLVLGGDLIYGTDAAAMLKWKRLINSLRLRLLLRALNRDSELNVKSQIEAILANPTNNPLLESNADDAILKYTGAYPYYNPYYNARTLDWRQGDYYTTHFINPMIQQNDPRLKVWASTVKVNGQDVYSGIESGYESDVVYVTDKNSSYNDNLKTTPVLGVIMTYAEMEFIKAELALRGFNTGSTPKNHYEKGIKASMTQWGVTVDNSYLQQEGILYNGNGSFDQQLEQIITQKYYAYYFVDMQSWFEKRRTGYPVLPRGAGILPENKFPSRLMYPTYLQSLNPSGLQQAIETLGGSDVSTIKCWWEK